MYWWNVSKLAEDLREGSVDERGRFKYFLATIILWSFAAQLFFRFGSPFKIEYLIASAVNLAVMVIGISLCYRANKRGDNIDFIPRMICLGWPVAIQIILVVSAVFLFLCLMASLFKAATELAPFPLKFQELLNNAWNSLPESGLAISLLLVAVYFFLLYWYLTRVSQPKAVARSVEVKEMEGPLRVAAAVVFLLLLLITSFIGMDQITIWTHRLGLSKLLNFYAGTLLCWAFLAALALPFMWLQKRRKRT